MNAIARRQFLQYLGTGAAMSVGALEAACTLLQPVDSGNPLSRSVSREWEKIYRDQYRYDSSFDWVCSPNDTHACRIRAYVRNGIVVRSGATYDYQKYADLYGNHASINWNPRQCAKGYTFHRVLYGPYRLRHPIVRKGWKTLGRGRLPGADAGEQGQVQVRHARRRRVRSRSPGTTRSRTSPARWTPSRAATAARRARSACSRRATSRRW